MQPSLTRRDRVLGAFFGSAAGDALGYAVEFRSWSAIQRAYGPEGIQSYDLDEQGLAEFSDDTQMMLFTAVGLMRARMAVLVRDEPFEPVRFIYEAYLDWLETQGDRAVPHTPCFLMQVDTLFSLRAPGGTCLNALASGRMGTEKAPLNDRKGCGGIMRVAPVALLEPDMETVDVMKLAAAAAVITHGHPFGYLPAAFYAGLLHRILSQGELSMRELITATIEQFRRAYGKHPYAEPMVAYVNKACALAEGDRPDVDCIHELGGGWVGEEALYIALFCALRHSDDFVAALTSSVNHSGDSDSTGILVGGILGAYLGVQAIPDAFIEPLEALPLLQTLGHEICDLPFVPPLCGDPQLIAHYVDNTCLPEEDFNRTHCVRKDKYR